MIMPQVPETTTKRLAFVKYLSNHAVQQSHLPEPMRAASLLCFHDAIEFFLYIASEHLSCANNDMKFMAYWDVLERKLSKPLPHKVSMSRLNKARVALKHYGTLPSSLDVEAFRANAIAFLGDATSLIFGLAYENITMIDLVSDLEVRTRLQNATQLAKSDLRKAAEEVAIGFESLLANYERSKSRHGRSPFLFGEHLRVPFTQMSRDLEDFLRNLTNSMEAVQQAIRVLSFGIDFRMYTKFRLLTPYVFRPLRSDLVAHWPPLKDDLNPSKEDVEFCVEFVISSALQLQQFDYSATFGTTRLFI
jgi:hypothetical protein